MLKLEKYSFGIGDRFGCQAKALLKSIIKSNKEFNCDFVPVWNKSNREHSTIHTKPSDVRIAADIAVKELQWDKSYYVDADHINLSNVDPFIDSCNFFTIDVASYIGQETEPSLLEKFVNDHMKYVGKLRIPGISEAFDVDKESIRKIYQRFLFAIYKAYEIYSRIVAKKGQGNFITEVSMDEVTDAQTPLDLFFILSAIQKVGIPAETIAPKFSGRFNKGVDYVGDLELFEKEFEQNLMVIDYAVKEFGMSSNLKLSIHSGSDKFSIYPIMGRLIDKHDKGIHIKTAGTTWLEEMIGLALSGGKELELAKSIYEKAYGRKEELCAPYSTVIDIRDSSLPSPTEVNTWSSEKFADSLRHIPSNKDYNPNFRQLVHVGYKIAAEYGDEYIQAVRKSEECIETQVINNIHERHITRLKKFNTVIS